MSNLGRQLIYETTMRKQAGSQQRLYTLLVYRSALVGGVRYELHTARVYGSTVQGLHFIKSGTAFEIAAMFDLYVLERRKEKYKTVTGGTVSAADATKTWHDKAPIEFPAALNQNQPAVAPTPGVTGQGQAQTEAELVWETTLHCQEGGSDKVYSLLIVREPPLNGGSFVGPLYSLCFAYGRRGAKLQTGDKETHQTWNTCALQHNGIVLEKQNKGYKIQVGAILNTFTPLCQTLNPSPSLYKYFPGLVKPGPLPLAPNPKNSTVQVNGHDFNIAGDVDVKTKLPHLSVTGTKKPILLMGAAEVFQTKKTKAQEAKERRIAKLQQTLAKLGGVVEQPAGSSSGHRPAQLPMNTGRKITFDDE